MNRGQIQIGVIGVFIAGVGMVVSPIVAYYSGQAATAQDISNLSERTVRLETSVPAIMQDTQEIKEDIKDLKAYFNIK